MQMTSTLNIYYISELGYVDSQTLNAEQAESRMNETDIYVTYEIKNISFKMSENILWILMYLFNQ